MYHGPHRNPSREEIEELIEHMHHNLGYLVFAPAKDATVQDSEMVVEGHSGLYTLHYPMPHGTQTVAYAELVRILETTESTITPYS